MKELFLLKCFINHNRSHFWFIILFVFIFFSFLTEEASSQLSFYVSPPLLEIDQIGGGTRNFTIEVSNIGQEKIQVKTSFSDLLLSADGKVELINPVGTAPHSIASWLITKYDEIAFLEPGETKNLLFQLRVPRGERGGRYGVIVFEALPLNVSKGQVTLGVRSGTLVFLTIPRTEEIKGIIKEISSLDGKGYKVVFQNTGNIHYKTEGSLIVKSEDGKVIHRISFPEDKPSFLLPKGKREFIITWEKKEPLSDGKYLLEVRMSAWVGKRLLNLNRKEITIDLVTKSVQIK